MKLILTLIFAALATSAGAKTPVVVDSDSRLTVRVSYADLNLRSTLGRERLYGRVTAAARAMCRHDNSDPLKVELAEQRCYAESIRAAGEKIDQVIKAQSIIFASGSDVIDIVRK